MKNMITAVLDGLRRGDTLAMATIITQEGSAPRTAGSKMLVADTQGIPSILSGTVGGGLLEGESLRAAAEVMASGMPRVLEFDMSGELAAGADMICGGKVRVFLEPLSQEDSPLFEALDKSLREGRGAWTVTALDGKKRWLLERHEAADRLSLSSPGLVEENGKAFFVEPWPVSPRLILAGGGHVAQSTAAVAAIAGFEVIVLDDRPEFAAPERFPSASLTRVTPAFTQCFQGLVMDANTFVAIVTRGHVHDATVLEQALATKAGYIGMIGSKRKRESVYDALRAKGVSGLERVACPIGLSIGAETPGEIAVSIVAECIAACHRK